MVRESHVWEVRSQPAFGWPLNKGDIVLTGALGPMATVAAGDAITARINGLGSVTAYFQD